MSWFTENWKIKLVSIIVAIITWYYVRDIKMNTITIPVPITYEQKPDNLYWKKDPPRYLQLSVRGRQEALKFPTGNLKASVYLGDAEAGRKQYKVKFVAEQIPDKIEITSMAKAIKIDLEKAVRKIVPVKVMVQGEIAEGFKKGKTLVTPKSITIEGPESKIREIKYVQTEWVNLENAQKSLVVRKALIKPRQSKIIDHQSVEVQITISTQDNTREKTISGIKVEVEGLDPALEVRLSSLEIKIRVTGNPEVINKLSADSFQAYVNLEGTRFIPKTGAIMPFDTESEIDIIIRILTNKKAIDIIEIMPNYLTVRFSVKPEYIKEPEENNDPDDNDNNGELNDGN
ncbi:MAG: CdaR family protein [Leptospirales bacterium]